MADVQMFMPIDKTKVNLNELITAPNNYWGDDNGDGKGASGITATGTLTLHIQDSTGKNLNRSDKLSLCDGASYYIVVLSSTAGILKTKYGSPNNTNFAASNVTYYIKPKTKPYACYARPNMAYSGSNNPNNYSRIDGPVNQWDSYKGFKPQNINIPSSNFPTMGASSLFFNLSMVGDKVNWQNMSYDKNPSNSGIDITINDGGRTNIAKVLLIGPRYNTNNAKTAVPTTFILYSDKAKTNKIYSFKINKWFIGTPGNGGGYNANYCANRYGSGYRIPRVAEYTNANNTSQNWTGGLVGQPNNYQRRIGGGLLAEWGNIYGNDYYTNLNFATALGGNWAFESYGSDKRLIDTGNGYVNYGYISNLYGRFACVTP